MNVFSLNVANTQIDASHSDATYFWSGPRCAQADWTWNWSERGVLPEMTGENQHLHK